MELRVSKDRTFEVKKIGVCKAWTVYRYILAKSVYDPKEVNEKDVTIANQLYLRFSYQSPLEEEEWYLDHYRRILSSEKRLSFINLEFEKEKIKKMEEHAWKSFERHHHLFQQPLSPRAYLGLVSDRTFQRIYKTILRPQNRKLLDSKSYPQRYVGVGYQDKGNARNKAEDSSPEWQEVAMSKKIHLRRQERILEERLQLIQNQVPYLSIEASRRLTSLLGDNRSKDKALEGISRLHEIVSKMTNRFESIDSSNKVCFLSRRNRK